MLHQLASVMYKELGLESIHSALLQVTRQTDFNKIGALAVRTFIIASVVSALRKALRRVQARLSRDLFPTAYLAFNDTSFLWVMAWLSQDPGAQAQINNFQLLTTEGRELRRGGNGLRALRASSRKVGEHNASWTSEAVIGQVLPTYGQRIRIKHGSNYLWITRKASGFAGSTNKPVDHLRIQTLGWQRSALRDFLSAAHDRYFAKMDQELLIFNPEYIGQGWQRPICRPARPWSSVILPESIKDDLLADVENFLSEEEIAWYAERGIPHRRGYLLYGEPGSGKTTLATAIASKLKLDVYLINPSVRGMDDARLNKLFRDVPASSVILIEDIDCVFPPGSAKSKGRLSPSVPAKSDGEEGATAGPPKFTPAPSSGARSGSTTITMQPVVTLSGLLNAIDGVSSQEGCILIASTNFPEHLDSALRRPGRFDIQIPFHNATPQQARALFKHFYPISMTDKLVEKGTITTTNDLDSLASNFADAIFPAEAKAEEGLSEAAAEMKPKGFSMAALQGYLMRFKHDPLAALEGARAWAEGHYEEKMPRKVVMLAPGGKAEVEKKLVKKVNKVKVEKGPTVEAVAEDAQMAGKGIEVDVKRSEPLESPVDTITAGSASVVGVVG